jgi:hypothetical protein
MKELDQRMKDLLAAREALDMKLLNPTADSNKKVSLAGETERRDLHHNLPLGR